MKKIIFILNISLLFCFASFAQTNILKLDGNQEVLQKRLDSAMRSFYFITNADADKILGKPSHLKDSMYKCTNGFLRYTFDYVANRVDSTSKGRIFFTFEQYKDDQYAGDIYKTIKTENEKSGGLIALTNVGDEGFLQKDNIGQSFIIIREKNKIYKVRVYNITSNSSLDEAMKVAKKIVAAH